MNGNREVRSSVVLLLACAAGAFGAAAARGSCLSNFEARGSIFKGRAYSTFADFPNVPVAVGEVIVAMQQRAKERHR